MKKYLLIIFILALTISSYAQTAPFGGQWGCPSVPVTGAFDTTCFKKTGEIKLGQGYFDQFGSSDPIYAIIPQNRPSYAIGFAVAWAYYRNVLGNDGMGINQWFATAIQENGFSTYNDGVSLPNTIYDVEAGTNVAVPCDYPRGCNSNTCAGAGYCWHVSQNGTDGPFHNTQTGYITIAPYIPNRYPAPATTYQPKFNSTFEMAAMNKTFYDLSIYRRAQYLNGVDLASIESSGNDPYGVEAAQGYAYNIGPNGSNSISLQGYTLPAGLSTNTNWASSYYSGGVSCYAQRISSITAVLDNNEAYAVSHYPAGCGGTVTNWDFYSFYDQLISWDTVSASIDRLLIMYPDVNAAVYKAKVQAAFNSVKGGLPLSYRYEFGAVVDALVMNLPKDDPGATAAYAIVPNGKCKLGCRAPYARIIPKSPLAICPGQTVLLEADVDSPNSTVQYQWQLNGANIAGATSSSYTASAAGTYGLSVCWTSNLEGTASSVTCCAQTQCTVTITAMANCGTCGINFTAVPTANSCTGMNNGSIAVTVTSTPGGYVAGEDFTYILIGPSNPTLVTSANSNLLTRNYSGLTDGRYVVEIRRASNPANCFLMKDVIITPTTVIKESLTAANLGGSSCNKQLKATLVNQKPNTCNVRLSWGALTTNNWDASYSQSFIVNGQTYKYMYEYVNNATTQDDPWAWWPYNWPQGGPGGGGAGAPNWQNISVNDGDTIWGTASTIVPLGTPAPGFINGGLVVDLVTAGTTFTNLATSANVTNIQWKYQGAAPVTGTRQLIDNVTGTFTKYIVNCPVVAPPAYTYLWTPATGLSNPAITNPVAALNGTQTYTITATHPTNASCKLTASVSVTDNCSTLPVEFISFDAEEINSVVNLSWITGSEKNCKTYVVERSKDGIHFSSIGSVDCSNAGHVTEYKLEDYNAVVGGISYYRIKEEDNDGLSFYSEVREISINNIQIQIHPNPFGNDTKVHIEGTLNEPVKISVTDLIGRSLWEKTLTTEKDIILGAELSAGVYIVQVSYKNVNRNYKIVKQ
ncbi:MAG: T9SS type A sorting domain-containing protein [Cytophagaceae bacterium]